MLYLVLKRVKLDFANSFKTTLYSESATNVLETEQYFSKKVVQLLQLYPLMSPSKKTT
jgi:hypothetical protein